MAKFKVSLGIGFANAYQTDVLDVDDDDLANCKTDDDREDLLQSYWQDWANNYIDGAITEVKDNP